jgi:hypothetical protein
MLYKKIKIFIDILSDVIYIDTQRFAKICGTMSDFEEAGIELFRSGFEAIFARKEVQFTIYEAFEF